LVTLTGRLQVTTASKPNLKCTDDFCADAGAEASAMTMASNSDEVRILPPPESPGAILLAPQRRSIVLLDGQQRDSSLPQASACARGWDALCAPAECRLLPPRVKFRLGFSSRHRAFALGGDPPRRRQRCACPRDELVRLVEQALRRAPEGEVDGATFLRVVERWKGFCFLEDCPVLVIDPKVESVVPHHSEHQAVAEHAGLSEHASHGDMAERRELLAKESGKAVAGNHFRTAPTPTSVVTPRPSPGHRRAISR